MAVPREIPPGKKLVGLPTEVEESNIVALEKQARDIVARLLDIETQALARLANISVTGTGGLTGGGNLTDSRTLSIASGGVTTAKIADANVTTAKIADANVTTAKIADGNVTGAKLENSGVTAGTYASPTSVTVDAKGRITSIT